MRQRNALRAAYHYTLDKHFLPRFGSVQMRRISPAVVPAWVNDATKTNLPAGTMVKCHMPPHRIFVRAAQCPWARRQRLSRWLLGAD